MFYMKKINAILLSLFLLFFGFVCMVVIVVIGEMVSSEVLAEASYGHTKYLTMAMFGSCNLGSALIYSMPIWFAPFKNEKNRFIRQIITILIYIVIGILGWCAIFGWF